MPTTTAKRAKGKMKPDIKRKWLKALRSGKYKQGTDMLARTNEAGKPKGYCCLGVLTDLYIKEKPKTRAWGKQEHYSNTGLSSSVQRWAGLKNSIPDVRVKGFENEVSLATLNDGDLHGDIPVKKHNFKKIAAIISAAL